MLSALFLNGMIIVGFLGVFNRWLDEEIVADICLMGLVVELVSAILFTSFLQVTDGVFFLHGGTVPLSSFIPDVSLVFCFDEISGYFLAILAFALFFCFFFLVEYFEYDANASSIIYLSALFSQAALLYFCTFDLFVLFFFWEAISFISFFLIQHWSFSLVSYKAGLKVFSVSTVGDLPFFFFCFLLVSHTSTTDLTEILTYLPAMAFDYFCCGGVLIHVLTVLALTLQVAVFLKAAQWFFYPWLLDAMEAPVPISAQLHSSTLVVIGFYLFFSFQSLFVLVPVSSLSFVGAGIVTSVGASVLGFFQEDGKKLLACSTAGQLGYVMVSLGAQLYPEALLLLTFCCCNNAAAFVLFGVLMRSHSGVSDFSVLGGSASLSWFEHAGLFIIICNFTVFPGVFCWHTNGLFLEEVSLVEGVTAGLGLGVLQLTWFLSSLYLWSLYLVLFAHTARSKNYTASASSTSNATTTALVNSVLSRQITQVVTFIRAGYANHMTPWFLLWSYLSIALLLYAWGWGGLFFHDFAWVDHALSTLSYF